MDPITFHAFVEELQAIEKEAGWGDLANLLTKSPKAVAGAGSGVKALSGIPGATGGAARYARGAGGVLPAQGVAKPGAFKGVSRPSPAAQSNFPGMFAYG